MTITVAFLGAIGVLELIIGFKNRNVHLIRDFITSSLMIISMLVSFKAAQYSKKGRNPQFNYGFLRVNIIAAFTNMIYILCSVLFKFLDLVHTMIEHKEEQSHAQVHASEGHTVAEIVGHDDHAH